MNNKAIKFWAELNSTDITKWKLKKIIQNNNHCCCGTPIKTEYHIENQTQNKNKIIGKCCARRLGIKLSWTTKANYLATAKILAKNKWETQFIQSLQDKLPAWGNQLIITTKQKTCLEKITKHTWRGKVWDNQ